MKATLCFLICRHFRQEVEAIFASEGFDDVVVSAFPANCGHPPLTRTDVEQAPGRQEVCQVEIVGGQCLGNLPLSDLPPHYHVHTRQNCFYFLSDPVLIDLYTRQGAYLVTPGWLAHWQAHLAEWGFEQAGAREFFAESVTQLVLLDTGVDENSPQHLRQFAGFVNLPSEILPVGLQRFRLFLVNLVFAWRVELERTQAAQSADSAQKQIANYAMAMELLNELVNATSEMAAIQSIVTTFHMLFAPERIFYMPIYDGEPGPIYSEKLAVMNDEAIRDRLNRLDQEYAWMTGKHGFLLRISHQGDLLGVVEIEGFAFPQYKEHYRKIALTLVKICGLAVTNARTYQQLIIAKDHAESANRAKSLFLSKMGHEFRTPLNALLGYAQLLERNKPLMETHGQAITTIHRSGEHLLNLVNEILNFCKLETKSIELHPSDFHLPDLLRQIVKQVHPDARKKRVVLRHEFSPGLLEGVHWDKKRLQQVLISLLDNAVKFTDSGSVSFRVYEVNTKTLHHSTTQPIRFEIEDTGMGIAAGEQEMIFKPFYQIGELGEMAGGIGIGLSVSHALVKIMGGELRVTSTAGQGSTFWFDVNIPPSHHPVQSQETPLQPGERSSPAPGTLVVPPEEELHHLFKSARMGDILAIQDWIKHVNALDEKYGPFASEIAFHAKNYDIRDILEFITPYLKNE